jgi:hypothetical protein
MCVVMRGVCRQVEMFGKLFTLVNANAATKTYAQEVKRRDRIIMAAS